MLVNITLLSIPFQILHHVEEEASAAAVVAVEEVNVFKKNN